MWNFGSKGIRWVTKKLKLDSKIKINEYSWIYEEKNQKTTKIKWCTQIKFFHWKYFFNLSAI